MNPINNSQDTHDKLMTLHFNQLMEQLIGGYCTYMAGLGEVCSLVAAILCLESAARSKLTN